MTPAQKRVAMVKAISSLILGGYLLANVKGLEKPKVKLNSSSNYGEVTIKLDDGTEVGRGGLTNGFVDLEINVKSYDKKLAGGREVFNEIVNTIKKESGEGSITGIKAVWTEALPDNLNTFNKLITTKVSKGIMTIEEAALSTFTGKMAIENGFTKILRKETGELMINGIKNLDGTYKYVTIIFSK